MRYLGGKAKIAKWIVAAIRPHIRGRAFWDAFCGGLSVSRELVAAVGPGLVTDTNPALIALYRAVASGWTPPSSITLEDYHAAKLLPDADPRKALIGFGASFGGKWFGGYARSTNAKGGPRNHLDETSRALVEEVAELAGCEFACLDFLKTKPKPINMVMYLDPPYAGTEAYGATAPFDHTAFYELALAWSRFTDVFISEYTCPVGRCVLEFGHSLQLTGGQQTNARTERLYHLAPGDL